MVCVILSIEDDGIAQSVRRGNREERGGNHAKALWTHTQFGCGGFAFTY